MEKTIKVTVCGISKSDLATLFRGVSTQTISKWMETCPGQDRNRGFFSNGKVYYPYDAAIKHLKDRWQSKRFMPCREQLNEILYQNKNVEFFNFTDPNPEYVKCSAEKAELEVRLAQLLADKQGYPAKNLARASALAKEQAEILANPSFIPEWFTDGLEAVESLLNRCNNKLSE